MKKSTYICWMLALTLIILLTLPYFLYILKVIFISKSGNFWGQEKIYIWCAIGVSLFLLLRAIIRSKSRFIETFSHELTHALVALVLGRKVHSFHVEDSGSGVIFTSGNNNYTLVPVALAPYCLPIFTYICLAIRCLVSHDNLWICDIIIGITIGFHYICFKTQIGSYQTDINQYPLSFSYFYIITAWLLNICIILVSLFPNMNVRDGVWEYGVFSSILRLIIEWWQNILMYIHFLQ